MLEFWKFRNDNLFRGRKDLLEAVCMFNIQVEDLLKSQETIKHLDTNFSLWKLSPTGWTKVNVDASVMSKRAVVAFVVCEHTRKMLYLASKCIICKTVFKAEVVRSWAIEYAKKCDQMNLQWSCDALQVVNEVICVGDPTRWTTRQDIIAIKNRLTKHEWTLEWNVRESNGLADAVAHFTHFTTLNKIGLYCDEFLWASLSCVHLDAVFKDQLGFVM